MKMTRFSNLCSCQIFLTVENDCCLDILNNLNYKPLFSLLSHTYSSFCCSPDATHDFYKSWRLQGQGNTSITLFYCFLLHWICREQGFGTDPWGYRIYQQAYWFRGRMAFGNCSVFLSEWCKVQAGWEIQQRDTWFWVQRCLANTEHAYFVTFLNWTTAKLNSSKDKAEGWIWSWRKLQMKERKNRNFFII